MRVTMSTSSRLKRFRSEHRRLYCGVLILLVIVCVMVIVREVYGPNGYLTYRRQRQEHRALEQRISELRRENQQLENQVKALKSDPKAIERVARERMHLARPGEIIYIVSGDSGKPPGSAANSSAAPKP
jgi:cell division protein FtsB